MARGARQPTAGSEPVPPAVGPVPLRRNRDFMVLWSSQVVSTVGTRVTSIAYPLLVLAVTHSPARAGVVGFAQTLPFLLLYLPAGTFVDRWDRKRTMLVCDAGRAVALGSIAFTVALGWLTMIQVVVVALIEGSLFVLFDLAEGAALPQLVTGEQLQAAIAQNQAKTQGADIVGQPLGGVLFSIARLLPFLVDAVSYLVSFIALLYVRRSLQQPRGRQPTRLRTEIAEGLLWVWRQPFLRAAVGVIGGVNFVFNALTLVLVVRARELGASPALIGAMFAFVGVGGLLGSFVAPWAQRRYGARRVIVTTGWLWAVEIGVLVLLPNALSLGAVSGIRSFAAPAFNVVVNSHVYQVTPDRLLGRVRSAARLVAWGSIPLGTLAGGFLASAFGALTTVLILTSIMCAVAAAATLARGMRQLPTSRARNRQAIN
ncbi:MAG TPA: MFS transporter [Streptosporangiaceae bacterium]|nr:MFS transporter [Streptosporangiaceae bacterium]